MNHRALLPCLPRLVALLTTLGLALGQGPLPASAGAPTPREPQAPVLAALRAAAGEQLVVHLRATPGDLVLLLLGLPGEPLPLSIGTLDLDLAGVVVVGVARLGATGAGDLPTTFQLTDRVATFVFVLQAACGFPERPALSNSVRLRIG